MTEDGEKVECINGIGRLKEAVDETKKAVLGPATTQSFEQMKKNQILEEFNASSRVLGKVEDIQMNPDGINFKCRCAAPLNVPFTTRHSGRYPWADIRKGLPSPGFIFANKDWIKSNASFTINWANDSKKYIVRDGNLTICKEFPYSDLAQMLHKLDSVEAFEDYIISELAREYDNIMIRKVLNMDSTRFNRFVSMINATGGHFSMEGSTDVNPMVKIEIPYNMLYHLHIDGDGSTPRETNPKVPAISQIQTFNDRVVQVTFVDGSQTKCVCGKDEAFDLYEGIAFCLFKRFLGKEKGHKHFNDLMRYAFKKLDKQEENKKREAEIKAENKRHEENKKLQAQRRKEKKREEKIGIFVEALKRNRQTLINEMPVYCVPNPVFKPDENPYIAPGEPEPPAKPDAKVIDDGSTLFFDPLSGKTFISSREKILASMVALNKRILAHDWASVNEWYEELGLDSSGNLGEIMGWNLDHMIEIDFVNDIAGDGRECFSIVYVEGPVKFEEERA